jgi:hypothetical protein
MADEFMKGFGVLTGAGLVWMVIAGWYNTPKFDGPQLIGPSPEGLATLDQIALLLKDAMAVVAIGGALLFWVVLPAISEMREKSAS